MFFGNGSQTEDNGMRTGEYSEEALAFFYEMQLTLLLWADPGS